VSVARARFSPTSEGYALNVHAARAGGHAPAGLQVTDEGIELAERALIKIEHNI
jgi:hypothetical protein